MGKMKEVFMQERIKQLLDESYPQDGSYREQNHQPQFKGFNFKQQEDNYVTKSKDSRKSS